MCASHLTGELSDRINRLITHSDLRVNKDNDEKASFEIKILALNFFLIFQV